MKKIFILIICIYTILILLSCSKNIIENQTEIVEDIIEDLQTPTEEQLSNTFYPEWISLSENFYNSAKLYSPIDHDYNIKAKNQYFIGDAAYEFIKIWQEELDFQYNKCLQNIPEKFKEQFIKQQAAWEEYFSNDIFPEIAMTVDEEGIETSYGFVRESFLTKMDKIRDRTIEIMRMDCFINGLTAEFHYESKDK